MKKRSIIVIASVLIVLHFLVFTVLIGCNRTGSSPDEKTPAPPAASQPEAIPVSASATGLSGIDAAMPVEVGKLSTVQTGETIAQPAGRAGYLRSDRPVRRTKKVYPSLIDSPYRGAIVVDARTGKILFENRATTYCYPASVTKLMTLLIVLEQIDAGVIHLKDKVKITNEVAKIGGSQIWLDPRETDFTVDDMLYALVVHSANDAARALALHVAGSKAAFVDLMNRRARELGMNATIYHSEHGLPPSGGMQPDISTPYDIALLCLACLRHPETLRYTSTELKYIREGETMLATRNALAKRVDGYQGCDGLKTGYHSMGGWSLAATAERNGQRVLSVVLGSPDKKTRNNISRELLDKGFQLMGKPH